MKPLLGFATLAVTAATGNRRAASCEGASAVASGDGTKPNAAAAAVAAPPVPSSTLERVTDRAVDTVIGLVPVIVFGGLAFAASRSSVRVGLGRLLEQSDTLVVATTAALGWGVTQYVTHVDRRFDAADKIEKERIDAVKQTLDVLVKESRSRRW